MAALNTSTHGPSINKSYQTIVDAPLPASASLSPTHAQWAVFSVQAPLANAFQPDSHQESTLRVQASGDGELADLIEEFSDGRMQFAFVKVKDANTGLPKNVMIGWCGEGVPERNKGYFPSHMNTVSRILQGYHVQITARNDSMLTPESIVQKVADASGSKYSGAAAAPKSSSGPPPPVATKPVFTPSRVAGATSSFQPLSSRSRFPATQASAGDGWGDAEDVQRTTLQPVQSAYKPTKVDMASLTSQKQQSNYQAPERASDPDVVRGGYQPIGKVDIAALRKQAAESGRLEDDRPTTVKGSYEPVGKVDIAAIRARAAAAPSAPPTATAAETPQAPPEAEAPKSLADRSAAFTSAERLTSMPKPKVANRFGSTTSSFSGTKAPTPGGFGAQPTAPAVAPVGAASRTFADQGGKTPAQIWAEKKARQGGGPVPVPTSKADVPIESQASGGWSSGYSGKKWAAVSTSKTGESGGAAVSANATGEEPQQEEATSRADIGSIRDRFKDTAPMGSAPPHRDFSAPPAPPLDTSSKPNAGTARGVPMPGFATTAEPEHTSLPPPPPQPRSPDPPTPEEPSSPIRIAQPVARSHAQPLEAPEERFEAPPVPEESISRVAPAERDLEPEPQVASHDPARAAGAAAAASTFGAGAAAAADPGAAVGGKRARAEYDYEKAEENELELQEGEMIHNIDMVDEDWWMGQNSRGESGLFPSNYVTLVEDEDEAEPPSAAHETPSAPSAAPAAAVEEGEAGGVTATAEYDYDAAEENELSFPEGALITGIEFPDEDWWSGHYNGQFGLFPANFVTRH